MIRPATGSDFTGLRQLLDLMGSVNDAGLAGRYEAYVRDPQHLLAVADVDGSVCGYTWAQSYGAHLRSGESIVRLNDLAVVETCRRQGLGTALLGAVIDWSRHMGARYLQWQASAASVGFYERLGFVGDTKTDLEEHPFFEMDFADSAPRPRVAEPGQALL